MVTLVKTKCIIKQYIENRIRPQDVFNVLVRAKHFLFSPSENWHNNGDGNNLRWTGQKRRVSPLRMSSIIAYKILAIIWGKKKEKCNSVETATVTTASATTSKGKKTTLPSAESIKLKDFTEIRWQRCGAKRVKKKNGGAIWKTAAESSSCCV